jgi:hypothetical protein
VALGTSNWSTRPLMGPVGSETNASQPCTLPLCKWSFSTSRIGLYSGILSNNVIPEIWTSSLALKIHRDWQFQCSNLNSIRANDVLSNLLSSINRSVVSKKPRFLCLPYLMLSGSSFICIHASHQCLQERACPSLHSFRYEPLPIPLSSGASAKNLSLGLNFSPPEVGKK